MRKCGVHLKNLLTDILDFSKIEKGMLQFESVPFDIVLFSLLKLLGRLTKPTGF
jgi:hypothetical protein